MKAKAEILDEIKRVIKPLETTGLLRKNQPDKEFVLFAETLEMLYNKTFYIEKL